MVAKAPNDGDTQPINLLVFEARLEELRQLEATASATSQLIWQTVGVVVVGLGALLPFVAEQVHPGDAVILLYMVPIFCAIGVFQFGLWRRLADLGSERAIMRSALAELTVSIGGRPDTQPFFRASGIVGPTDDVGKTGYFAAAFPLLGLFPLATFYSLERHPNDLQWAIAWVANPILILSTAILIVVACHRKGREVKKILDKTSPTS